MNSASCSVYKTVTMKNSCQVGVVLGVAGGGGKVKCQVFIHQACLESGLAPGDIDDVRPSSVCAPRCCPAWRGRFCLRVLLCGHRCPSLRCRASRRGGVEPARPAEQGEGRLHCVRQHGTLGEGGGSPPPPGPLALSSTVSQRIQKRRETLLETQ